MVQNDFYVLLRRGWLVGESQYLWNVLRHRVTIEPLTLPFGCSQNQSPHVRASLRNEVCITNQRNGNHLVA